MFRQGLLSFALGFSFFLSFFILPYPLAIHICFLIIFHQTEFLLTALHNESEANIDSFLINHSPEYTAAHLFALGEYAIRGNKQITWIGMIVAAVGYAGRATAMHTAGKAFDHQVQETRKVGQKLVTTGIYG
jgi:protein-S-isoprenylcysteine O-methyltransferase